MRRRGYSDIGKGNGGPFADLLSVDADAHLQKLAACMFPSPTQLPVELVRASLKRGAVSIEVQLQNSRLSIIDNGRGISSVQWHSLAMAFDSGLAAADREKAIAFLQNDAHPGIGLLAVSMPGRLNIKIENASSQGKKTMLIEAGKVRQFDSSSLPMGTRISLSRSRGGGDAEKKLLRELCAAVPHDILLNGQKLEKKPLLRRTLVRQAVDSLKSAGPAMVAIPARGDVCRIWLLDQGIPWQAFTGAAHHGLVFEAALESDSPPSAACFALLADAAVRLYHWLAEHYMSYPEKYQARIEELIFRKVSQGGDLQLLSTFSPFRLWRAKRRLNLDEVRRKAENETLYALSLESDPGQILGRHAQALLLSPLQKDFLINHLRLPLVTPAAQMEKVGKSKGMLASWLRKIILLTAALLRPRTAVLTDDQMENEEKELCRKLENQWQRQQLRDAPGRPPLSLTVAMVEGRGFAPSFCLPAGQGFVLQLRRRHPLTRQALHCARSDPANIELIFAALAADLFLTAPGL